MASVPGSVPSSSRVPPVTSDDSPFHPKLGSVNSNMSRVDQSGLHSSCPSVGPPTHSSGIAQSDPLLILFHPLIEVSILLQRFPLSGPWGPLLFPKCHVVLPLKIKK